MDKVDQKGNQEMKRKFPVSGKCGYATTVSVDKLIGCDNLLYVFNEFATSSVPKLPCRLLEQFSAWYAPFDYITGCYY